MNKVEKKLKSCPFCGFEGFLDKPDYYDGLYHVICRRCGARTSSSQNKNHVINNWNRRIGEEEIQTQKRPSIQKKNTYNTRKF